MVRGVVTIALLLMFTIIGGCSGDSGPKTQPLSLVSGVVQLDGKPMEDGEIIFTTLGELPQVLPVKAGKFEGQVGVGEKRVEIRAYKIGEPVMMDGKPVGEPVKTNYLPAKYNTESTLKAKVEASGAKDLKFEVTSM